MRTIIIILWIMWVTFVAFPQNQNSTPKEKSANSETVSRKIIFGKKGDGFPERLSFNGVIEKASLSLAGCGMMRHASTLKVKLLDTIKGYSQKHVYLIVPCLTNAESEDAYLNKTICASVSKFYPWNDLEAIFNTIDSEETPFYYLNWQAWSKESFLNQFVCPTNETRSKSQ